MMKHLIKTFIALVAMAVIGVIGITVVNHYEQQKKPETAKEQSGSSSIGSVFSSILKRVNR